MPPLVPGFTITGELGSDATGSSWAAVRTLDDQPLVLRIIPVPDVSNAQVQATELMDLLDRIDNEHLVRTRDAIATTDGALALVLDQVTGCSLAHVLGERGHLTAGETVTTVAPLFGALADLHAAGVVLGDLAPRSVVFSDDGRPLISDLGVFRLLGRGGRPTDPDESFSAPEVVGGAEPSSASDVYGLAALGLFCLSGAPPGPATSRPSLGKLGPRTPARLVDVLTSCLLSNPSARPSARAAAMEVFDAAPPESVVLTSVADPATEITRRIRATAASAPLLAPPPPRQLRRSLVIGAVVVLVAAVIGGSSTWFRGRTQGPDQPAAVRLLGEPVRSPQKSPWPPSAEPTAKAGVTDPVPATRPRVVTDVVTARDSPRTAAGGLLQALVDARALAYAARNPGLLDLVYAPGATKASADRANLATSLENGATYIGLAFVVEDASFLDETADTARVRATIVTPAYETGQPDGREVPHEQEAVGPSVFTLRLTLDGWRILSLTAEG